MSSKIGNANKRVARAARRLPAYLQHVAFTKTSKARAVTGTFRPASAVRHIDPKTFIDGKATE